MLQTVKDLVQLLVISTNQNNITQPNTFFTHDQSNSNPTHNQPSNIHPSSITHPQHQVQYNQTNLNTNQLNDQILTPHQQQIVYANASQQFQLNSANPTYQQITQVLQQHSSRQQSLTNFPINHQHNQNTSNMQQLLNSTPPPSPHTWPPPSSPHNTNPKTSIDEDL